MKANWPIEHKNVLTYLFKLITCSASLHQDHAWEWEYQLGAILVCRRGSAVVEIRGATSHPQTTRSRKCGREEKGRKRCGNCAMFSPCSQRDLGHSQLAISPEQEFIKTTYVFDFFSLLFSKRDIIKNCLYMPELLIMSKSIMPLSSAVKNQAGELKF